ncbi:MAG: lysophospholipid acyltransferase family protein [bacterium]
MIKFTIAKENTLRGKIVYLFLKMIIAPIVRLVWVKKITGQENLPKTGPFIIAANHQGYFDFISLVCVLPDKLTFLAAEKFFASRFWRPIMEYTGQIKVERYSGDNKDKAAALALKVLECGKVLAIFPQGTRSRTGEIGQTYTGVAKFALEAGAPVVPIGIKGTFEVMPPSAKKPRTKKIIELHIGKPMEFDGPQTPEVYRRITDEIMAEVARLAGLTLFQKTL